METEIELLKRKILDEELEYWKLKYDAAAYEEDYWRAMAMNAGIDYDLVNNTKSFPIRHAPAQHREGSGGSRRVNELPEVRARRISAHERGNAA